LNRAGCSACEHSLCRSLDSFWDCRWL